MVVDVALYLFLSIGWDVVSAMPSVKQLSNKSFPLPQHHVSFADAMALAKKERVRSLDPRTQIPWVNNIRKCCGAAMHAARGISFSCPDGKVFGLLGVDGAGKTTTFKMLCGPGPPTESSILIA